MPYVWIVWVAALSHNDISIATYFLSRRSTPDSKAFENRYFFGFTI